MAVPGIKIQVLDDAGGDPLGREDTGSVVGIQIEVVGMYTGTLIQDLMATVERAERDVRHRQVSEVVELQRLYDLQAPSIMTSVIPSVGGEQVYVGAA